MIVPTALILALLLVLVLPRMPLFHPANDAQLVAAPTEDVEPPSDESSEPGELDDAAWEDESEVESEPTARPHMTAQRELGEIAKGARISDKRLGFQQRAYKAGKIDNAYTREQPILMGAGEDYAELPGVTTFRGNNHRDNSAYGLVPDDAGKLTVKWSAPVGGLDDWNGVGWTGQAAIVKWPDDVKNQMNIKTSKKQKDGLKEVIIAALDGKIRFLDLDDGKATRGVIDIGAPIKGSVTVDPRGYPLLYCGQGIFEVHGKTVKCGTRVFSLIDQKTLMLLNGNDKFRLRNWYCFDAAPLIDAKTDTMLQVGENGLVYLVKLNTDYDRAAGSVKISPSVDRYGYKSKVTKRPGMENSIAVYSHYGYFADNSGLLICLDLNTLKAQWAVPTGDDTDATCAIEEDDEGVWLYTANEMDLRAKTGNIQMRCYDALTGKARWKADVHVNDNKFGGAFASPAIGKGALSELVYFNIAKTNKGGTLYALNKKMGKPAWTVALGAYSWSTPSLMYDSKGRGYLLIGNSNGTLRLIDGLTGALIHRLELKDNIEGSPSVYDNMAVVSTRGGRIFGVEIS